MASVKLRKSKAGPAWAGHPWIFTGSVASGHDGAAGSWVQVCDHRGEAIGWGLLSPNSQIRVRLVSWGADPPVAPGTELAGEASYWVRRLTGALARRGLGKSPRPAEARRLVNSEGDGIPGLTLDLFGDVAVVQISTLPMAMRRSVLLQAIEEVVSPSAILLSDPPKAAELEGFAPERGWFGAGVDGPVDFVDGGVAYQLDSDNLQKTGHYLDVRQHRLWVAERSAGRSVFDGYCFSGGFSLTAAQAGAARCLGVDSSAAAVEAARKNAARVGVDKSVEFVRVDVFDKMRSCADRGETFDSVVLDPPKLVPRARDRHKAVKVYEALALEGLRILAPGGIFGLSSCSHHLAESDLTRVIAAAGSRRGRMLDVVCVGGHDGDHPYPVAMREGRYLTFVFCQERVA